ncbi:MAG: NAD(P)H-dependent oxidoreductase subunit E, partial [Oscillospiraceae bacterium]|nr:NAD(P)H-dependent oxidoreductase subunit E [Oscillospiraceae bacterium]
MKSLDELKKIRDDMQRKVSIRNKNENGVRVAGGPERAHIMVCGGTGCTASDSPKLIEEFRKELAAAGLDKEVCVVQTGCFGLCALGPIVIVYPEDTFYVRIALEDVKEIVTEHIINGRLVERLLYMEAGKKEPTYSLDDSMFYSLQKRIALRNCGVVDPEVIDEYIAYDGYMALAECLLRKTPEEVIKIVSDSGLRGRGGAGFPTGTKWKFTAASEDPVKYVCCNADEGDPGAFMDRSVLEGDPHSVIEAMMIAAFAIGASQGYVYVRAEYPIAVHRLRIAIEQAKEYGILGDNIFGSGFNFHLDIRLGAGAFVCGEETALMRSIEGQRGEPRPRPP